MSQIRVASVFTDVFGRTPLKQRMDDILHQVIDLTRATDDRDIDEHLGDALASMLALCAERGKLYSNLIDNTLNKIESRRQQYKSLGRKISVAILGGAFDPIHNGHIQVAKFVLNTSKAFDEVWLMPAYQHMYGKKMVDSFTRTRMCHYASSVDRRIKVFTYEIDNKLSGETYQTMKLLKEDAKYKDTHDFSLIIGLDNANTFSNWVNSEYLEKLVRFVVVPRKGVEPKADWFFKHPHIYLNNEEHLNIDEISSTQIRKILKDKKKRSKFKNLEPYLNKLVHECIIDHKFYK